MAEFATLDEKIKMLGLKVDRLEQMLLAKINSDNMSKQYTDADIKGTRQSVANITPTTMTKTAYIDDDNIVFTNVPDGYLTVYYDKPFSITRDFDTVIITFDPLEEVTDITISIFKEV